VQSATRTTLASYRAWADALPVIRMRLPGWADSYLRELEKRARSWQKKVAIDSGRRNTRPPIGCWPRGLAKRLALSRDEDSQPSLSQSRAVAGPAEGGSRAMLRSQAGPNASHTKRAKHNFNSAGHAPGLSVPLLLGPHRSKPRMVVYGATVNGGTLCCDATRTRHPRACAQAIDGAALRVAECRATALGSAATEVGGLFNAQALRCARHAAGEGWVERSQQGCR